MRIGVVGRLPLLCLLLASVEAWGKPADPVIEGNEESKPDPLEVATRQITETAKDLCPRQTQDELADLVCSLSDPRIARLALATDARDPSAIFTSARAGEASARAGRSDRPRGCRTP